MAVAYPSTLPTARRASKVRAQGAPFRATDPGRGKLYVQRTGADNPVMWDLEFRFSRAQAVSFKSWFETDLQRGLLQFTLPIRTEFGTISHTCQFLPDGLIACQQEGETFTYSARIVSRAQVIPARYLEASELIIGLPDWLLWAQLLDEAITREMPQ